MLRKQFQFLTDFGGLSAFIYMLLLLRRAFVEYARGAFPANLRV